MYAIFSLTLGIGFQGAKLRWNSFEVFVFLASFLLRFLNNRWEFFNETRRYLGDWPRWKNFYFYFDNLTNFADGAESMKITTIFQYKMLSRKPIMPPRVRSWWHEVGSVVPRDRLRWKSFTLFYDLFLTLFVSLWVIWLFWKGDNDVVVIGSSLRPTWIEHEIQMGSLPLTWKIFTTSFPRSLLFIYLKWLLTDRITGIDEWCGKNREHYDINPPLWRHYNVTMNVEIFLSASNERICLLYSSWTTTLDCYLESVSCIEWPSDIGTSRCK